MRWKISKLALSEITTNRSINFWICKNINGYFKFRKVTSNIMVYIFLSKY